MKPVGVLRFLGTNCDADVISALGFLKIPCEYIWWADRFDQEKYSGFVLPGGFSYGDYLRAGALAARAPAMKDLSEAAKKGKPVLGICNGFQILCEARLLEGVLTKNVSLRFQEEWVCVTQNQSKSLWKAKAHKLRLPIAHSMGRFLAPPGTLAKLRDSGQIWLAYEKNPNGSLMDIAGICNEQGHVAALMPHPERAMADWMGSDDGRQIFEVMNS